MPSPTQAVTKTSGFQFNVCCSIFSCGFPYAEYGQYIFPDMPKPITQVMEPDEGLPFQPSFSQDFNQTETNEKPYTVTAERAGGCNLSIPCVLSFGCPAFEYNYKNKQTGDMIFSLPQITKEQAAQDPSGVIKSTLSARSAHLKACCCCGPTVSLSSKLGFFKLPNAAEEQGPPPYLAPQAMSMS